MKNFTKAADRNYVAQTALSHAVTKLEQELGIQLLIRNPGNVATTDAGQVFYQECKEILDIHRAALKEIERLKSEEQNVRIGFIDIYECVRFMDLQKHLERQFPGYCFAWVDQYSVPKECLDIAVGYDFEPKLEGAIGSAAFAVGRGNGLSCLVSRENVLAGRALIKKEDLTGQTLVVLIRDRNIYTEKYEKSLRQKCLKNVSCKVHFVYSALERRTLVECNAGIALFEREMFKFDPELCEAIDIEDCKNIRYCISYRSTWNYVFHVFKERKITYEVVTDFHTYDFEAVTPDTRMVFIETPSNPLLGVTDIQSVCGKAHAKGLLTVVDNTFMTSYLQKPLQLGADIVVYSATKYYAGHSDIIAGAVVVDDDELYEQLKFHQKILGAILSPFDSFLLARGIRTLPIRMDRSQGNAKILTEYLEKHEAVDRVYYPGLVSNDGYELQKRQASGCGAVFSVLLNKAYDSVKFCNSLKLFDLAVSLGGVESLVCHPATMTHESYAPELQEEIGIKEELLRFAVGIEDINAQCVFVFAPAILPVS